MSTLEATIATANRPMRVRSASWVAGANVVQCVDGFSVSVISGEGAYCAPRDDDGPYEAVECGFPSARPEPWSEWEEFCESHSYPTGTVYGFVPVEMVRALVALHGGEL